MVKWLDALTNAWNGPDHVLFGEEVLFVFFSKRRWSLMAARKIGMAGKQLKILNQPISMTNSKTFSKPLLPHWEGRLFVLKPLIFKPGFVPELLIHNQIKYYGPSRNSHRSFPS